MKRILILSLSILFFAQIVYAQDKIEAPVWNVGDKWTFKGVDGNTFTNQVMDIKEDLFVVRMGGNPNLNAFDKKNMNVKFLIAEGGRQVEADNPLRKLFDFPIAVGKKWSDVTTAYPPTGPKKRRMGKMIFDHDFKVEGTEEITTPAGKFNAYKIHYKSTDRNSNRSGWIRFWYSPEVKNWVKREAEKGRYWEETRWAKDAELISYSLK